MRPVEHRENLDSRRPRHRGAHVARGWQLSATASAACAPRRFDLPGHGDSAALPQRQHHADLLERPLDEALRERNGGLDRLRAAGTPYLTIHSCRVDPFDAAWLHERLPHGEILVWPVGHHFPHLTHPARLAVLLTGLAAGGSATRTANHNNDESEQT